MAPRVFHFDTSASWHDALNCTDLGPALGGVPSLDSSVRGRTSLNKLSTVRPLLTVFFLCTFCLQSPILHTTWIQSYHQHWAAPLKWAPIAFIVGKASR